MNEQVAQRAVLFVCEGLILCVNEERRTELIAPPKKYPLNSCVLIECDETKQKKVTSRKCEV